MKRLQLSLKSRRQMERNGSGGTRSSTSCTSICSGTNEPIHDSVESVSSNKLTNVNESSYYAGSKNQLESVQKEIFNTENRASRSDVLCCQSIGSSPTSTPEKHFHQMLLNEQEHQNKMEVNCQDTSLRQESALEHGVKNSQRLFDNNATLIDMKGHVSMKRQASLLSFFQKQPSRPQRKSQVSLECRTLPKPSLPMLVQQPQTLAATQVQVHLPSSSLSVEETPHSHTRICPFYKKVPGTSFTVDAFSYGSIPNCSYYFLSHFHYDHYTGLTRKFHHPIYCSKVTANLVKQQLKVSTEYVNALHMNRSYVLDGVEVQFLDANHCPGSIMILFKLPSGKNYLHTGDFRFSHDMLDYGPLLGVKLTHVFLDTTYCSPQYDFPTQDDVIAFVVDKVLTTLHNHPSTLIVCGTYTIGKEKVFMAIAEALGQTVCVLKEKKNILCCLEDAKISSTIITDPSASNIHVLPMARLTLESLTGYLGQFKSEYTTLLAFKPTGWTHSKSHINMGSIKPLSQGPVTIYGVPYSEHSSFSELKRFVKFIRPQKVIPTVNNFSARKREEMQRTFKQWLSTPGSPPKLKQKTLDTIVTMS